MHPPRLARCIANSLVSLSPRTTLSSSTRSTQFRPLTTKRATAKSVLVQLTKNIPKLGSRGDVVSIKAGRMRNTLHPYSMAQYIRPGTDSFLTQTRLAVPVGPNYRRLVRKLERDPVREEFQVLFERARKRLITEERNRPKFNARADVLMKIERYAKKVRDSKKWNQEEKDELLRFLAVQADGWGMLGENVGPTKKIMQLKESMLVETWRTFTQGVKLRREAKKAAKGEKGLERELSTSGTLIQGDVKIITEGVEAPVSSHEPVGQTVAHEESAASKDQQTL